MPRSAKSQEQPIRLRPPAMTPEEREDQLISLAIDQAEKQLMNGTAPAQVLVHYLKLASTKERLEKEKLAAENALLKAKADLIQSSKKTEELYQNALDAMRSYSGGKGEGSDLDD